MWQDSHLSDHQLLMELEGELPAREAKKARSHLDACWTCRARRQELESTIEGFVRVHQRELDAHLPPAAGQRALLRARLAELSATQSNMHRSWFGSLHKFVWPLAAGVFCLLFLVFIVYPKYARPRRVQALTVSVPDARLTPGAALLVGQGAVCSEANTKNKAVPVALQRKVFEEYGLQGAELRAYEVDYLITPALGGADDIHNLWPHSYSTAVWNARVKDALEDRLREMVCDGSLDLRQAQQEIATDWIAAYKKYFHTDAPLPEHRNGHTD